MKKGFLILICSILGHISVSQPMGEESPQKIKLLSWNIYMLPPGASSSNGRRATAIGVLLAQSDYDVIAFQEAFCPIARRKIRKELSAAFPYQAGPANRRFLSFKTNSGLWIFSKFPIVKSESIIFENRKGIDALSRKGALLAQLDVHGNPIQIIVTHLQNSGNISLRYAQCVELSEKLVLPFRMSGIPQVICGDFNINKITGAGYRFMLSSLDATDGEPEGERKFTYDRVSNDLHVENGAQQDLIDYVLLRENGARVNCTTRSIRALRYPWHRHHQDLSDHYSLEAELIFTNFPAVVSAR